MNYETNIVWYFLNVNVLTNSFCIEECLCTFRKLQYYVSIFYIGLSCWVLNMEAQYHTKFEI